jgi:hypothetical protein
LPRGGSQFRRHELAMQTAIFAALMLGVATDAVLTAAAA